MSYLPAGLPEPVHDEVNGPFWAHCNEERLCFQACGDCGHRTHPPMPVCPRCQSMNRRWDEAPARGRVFTFIWAHTAAHPTLREMPLPYNAAVVEFPEMPGVRLTSNVVDAQPGGLKIGDEVALMWEAVGAQKLPRFRALQRG